MFLKTGTKSQEIQKSELNTIKPNELFNFFSHILFHRVVLFLNYLIVLPYLEILILLLILWRHFPSKKNSKTEKQKKHAIIWNTKFYHPAKFKLKRIKNAKVVPGMRF